MRSICRPACSPVNSVSTAESPIPATNEPVSTAPNVPCIDIRDPKKTIRAQLRDGGLAALQGCRAELAETEIPAHVSGQHGRGPCRYVLREALRHATILPLIAGFPRLDATSGTERNVPVPQARANVPVDPGAGSAGPFRRAAAGAYSSRVRA